MAEVLNKPDNSDLEDAPFPAPIFTEEDFNRVAQAYHDLHGAKLNTRQVLVGGQALNFWLMYYEIDVSHIKTPFVLTQDVDFLSSIREAKELATAIGAKIELVSNLSINDVCVATATFKSASSDATLVIDFINTVCGIEDNEIIKHAVPAAIDDRILKVMHPIHTLVSRIANLHSIPHKRNTTGIEQARLSVLIAKSSLDVYISNGDMHSAHQLIRKVYDLARSPSGYYVFEYFHIDVLDAVNDVISNFREEVVISHNTLLALISSKRASYAENQKNARDKRAKEAARRAIAESHRQRVAS